MTLNKIILKNALLITVLIGGLFLIVKLLGFADNGFLRFLNLIFVLIGIQQAIKTNIYTNKETRYSANFGLGIQTSALAVIISIISILIYVEAINPEFLKTMENSFLIAGKNITTPKLIITLVLEGFASSVIGSFIVMQFYKNHDKKKLD